MNITNKKVIDIFNNNYFSYILFKELEWSKINIQIDHYKYIYSELNGKLFFDDIFDSKIKNILINPYIMFNYLEDYLSIMKWINISINYINQIFYQPIKINVEDIEDLSKILFYLKKINVQSLEDRYYNNLINISNKNTYLILFKNRINMKINNIFPNKNINLGHLVKDIKNNLSFNLIEF